MFLSSFSLNKKVILGFILFSALATAWHIFQDRGDTVLKQKEKIAELETNQTFTSVDTTVVVENAVTSTNAKNREIRLQEIIKEIADEKNNDVNVTYDESIFNGMYLYKTHLP